MRPTRIIIFITALVIGSILATILFQGFIKKSDQEREGLCGEVCFFGGVGGLDHPKEIFYRHQKKKKKGGK